MATTTYKNGQIAAPSASLTDYATVYNTSASATAVVSSLIVCNTSTSNILVRAGIMGSAGSPSSASGQFIWYDAAVAANDTLAFTAGLTLAQNQYLRISSDSVAANFTACIAEVTG